MKKQSLEKLKDLGMEIKTKKVDMDVVKYFEKLGYSSKEFKSGISVTTASFPIVLTL
jgi:hypothetical protein